MKREKYLFKNTLIITIGNLCTKLITFFLLPLYTAVLSTAEYGTVDLLNTLVSLLLPIVTFQVEQAVFRHLLEARENKEEISKIISTGFYSVLIQCILYFLIFLAISPFIKNKYKIFLVTNVIAHIFASLTQQIARGLGKNTNYAISSFIAATTTILFNIVLLVVFNFGVNGMLTATMVGQIVCLVYNCISLKIYKYVNLKKYDKKLLKKLWKYSLPLIPNAISWWVFNVSDRVIVSGIMGVSYTGLLSAASKFSMVYITFYNIFNMSWTEMVSLHIKDDDAEEFMNKMVNMIFKIFLSAGIIIIAVMPFVYPIMINKKFVEGYNQVPILMLGSILNVLVGLISTIYIANKNTKAVANTSIVSAAINLLVHILLIKKIGLYAASISTFASFFIMSIYRLYDLKRRYFEIKIDKKFIFLSVIIFSMVTSAFYYNKKPITVISIIISLAYGYLINKKSINTIINFAAKKVSRKR
jgi:O-antigen/teichoic acid export membrane protein